MRCIRASTTWVRVEYENISRNKRAKMFMSIVASQEIEGRDIVDVQ